MSLFPALLPFAAGALARATLVLLATAAALFALRRASAAIRHRVATAGLAAAVALPVLALVMPKVPTRYLPPLPSVAPTRPGLGAVLVALWAAGLAAVVARLVVGTLRVRRQSREATSLWDAEWIAERDEAARRLALTRTVALKESEDVSVAITSGWRRPFLLVGRIARHWAVERRRIVLLHELAHVKRADWPALLLAELAAAVYWFHPLAIWLVRRVRREAEQACDELVIASGTKPSVYAGHLLGIFRSVGEAPAPAAAALAMVRPHQFESRLRAILDPRTPGRATGMGGSFALAGLLTFSAGALLLVPCNAVRPLAGLGRVAPAAAAGKKPCPHATSGAAAKMVADARTGTRTETRTLTRTRVSTATETVPAAADASEPTVPDGAEPPATPEEGRSLPAIWRADAREAPRAASGFVLASNKHPRHDGGDWYDEGMRLHRRGKYAQAIEDFQKAIADDYRVDAASYNIACGYALLGDKDKAFEWLHKALDEGFELAGYLRSDDDLEDLHDDPRWAEIRTAARQSSSEVAKSRSVAARYERLAAKSTTDGESYFESGRELLRVDEYALAAKAFQQSAERHHRVGTSLYNEACALSLDGRKDAALDTLKKALDAGFDQPDLFRTDDDLDAIRHDPRFDALEKEAKDLSLPGYGYGGDWIFGGHRNRAKWRSSAKRYADYAEKHPQQGRAWYNLGFALLAGDRADEAAAPFQKALDLGYRKPTTMYNLACTYARLDQKDAAFDWLFKALDAGFDEESTLRHDDDLDNLRGDSRYRKAVEIARAKERDSDGE